MTKGKLSALMATIAVLPLMAATGCTTFNNYETPEQRNAALPSTHTERMTLQHNYGGDAHVTFTLALTPELRRIAEEHLKASRQNREMGLSLGFYLQENGAILHNENGAESIMTWSSGARIDEYYINNQIHRSDGPARIETRPDGSRIESYFDHGELLREVKIPAPAKAQKQTLQP